MTLRLIRSIASVFRFGPGRASERVRRLEAELARRTVTLDQLSSVIGYRPARRELFLEALLHRSYLPLTDGSWVSNERLEFLGDAVLNVVVADHVYRTFPENEEGDLTKTRSRLVNRRILAQRGRAIGLPQFLLLSSSAVQSLNDGSESIIADAFESIIGAIYLDGGWDAAGEFVRRTLLDAVDVHALATSDDNYKSALLEFTQARGFGVPRYTVVREEGPEHDRRFIIEVALGSEPFGTGTGRSKKDAEQSAAAQALDKIQRQPSSLERLSSSHDPS